MFSPAYPRKDDVNKRHELIARLTRLMKKDSGWTSLFPGATEAYARFLRTVNALPRHERRRAQGGLLLELAAYLIDTAISNGLTYRQIESDIAKIEQGLRKR